MNVNRNIFRLKHIIESIGKIEIITSEMSFDDFMADWIRQDAVIRNFQIIGEAVKHIDLPLIEKYGYVAWPEVKGMRNILIHEYFGVAYDQLWKTIQEDLPGFKKDIEKILEDLESNDKSLK